MLSLFMSHVIVMAHRHVLDDPTHIVDTSRESVANFGYTTPSGHMVRVTVWGRTLFTLILVVSFGLMIAGMTVNSFSFRFGGLVGFALSAQPMPNGADTNYSVLSLGIEIPNVSPDPTSLGTNMILVLYFMFGIIVPLLHCIMLVVIWFKKLTLAAQKRMLVATEILNAWSGVDVLVLALMAAIIEIKSFVQFMIGDKCDTVNVILARYLNKPLKGDDNCFTVEAELQSGCWLLFGAIIFYWIVSGVAMGAARRVVHSREGTGDESENATKEDQPTELAAITRLGKALGLVKIQMVA
jgi:hypothetical protein